MNTSDDLFFFDNLLRINKLIERMLLVTIIVPVSFFVLTRLNVWRVPDLHSLSIGIYTLVTYIIQHLLNKKRVFAKIAMHFGLFACSMFVILLATNKVISVNITFGIVPFITCLYYNKKVTAFSTFACFVLMIISFWSRHYGVIQTVYVYNANNWSDLHWFISTTVGFAVEYVFVFMVAFTTSNRTRATMDKLIETMAARDAVNYKLQEQNKTLRTTQNEIIQFVASLLGSHDLFTGFHVIHTCSYVKMIAEELRNSGFYVEELTEKVINDYRTAAFLHDIGKIHIPEGILNKPGKFTDQEYELMKCHPEEGLKLLKFLPKIDDGSLNVIAENMAYCHHEKYDGSGYPQGLKEKEIPLCARVMAAADVLDALISKRLYKDPMSIDKALEIFEESKGSHFEPCIADAVIRCREKIIELDAQFKETEADTSAKELLWWEKYHESMKD